MNFEIRGLIDEVLGMAKEKHKRNLARMDEEQYQRIQDAYNKVHEPATSTPALDRSAKLKEREMMIGGEKTKQELMNKGQLDVEGVKSLSEKYKADSEERRTGITAQGGIEQQRIDAEGKIKSADITGRAQILSSENQGGNQGGNQAQDADKTPEGMLFNAIIQAKPNATPDEISKIWASTLGKRSSNSVLAPRATQAPTYLENTDNVSNINPMNPVDASAFLSRQPGYEGIKQYSPTSSQVQTPEAPLTEEEKKKKYRSWLLSKNPGDIKLS